MLFYVLLNPGSTPFDSEMKKENIFGDQVFNFIEDKIRRGSLPEANPKYIPYHNSSWKVLQEVFVECLHVHPNKRALLKDIMEKLSTEYESILIPWNVQKDSDLEGAKLVNTGLLLF